MRYKKSAYEVEWEKLNKKEQKYLQAREAKKDSLLNQKLSEKVPVKLQSTLDKAFAKAFGMIFEKGTEVIEKTYKKEELQKTFKINEYTDEIRQNKRSVRAFAKKAENAGRVNMALSGITGIGMGIAGVGIPDIPVFTSMVLKSIYEIALNYGYDYETAEERRFILLIIQGAVSYGNEMLEVNRRIDDYILDGIVPEEYDEKIQIEHAAAGLSQELLYMKFIQGIPIVGAVGGAYDVVYLKRIVEYANLKYKKRFLSRRRAKLGEM